MISFSSHQSSSYGIYFMNMNCKGDDWEWPGFSSWFPLVFKGTKFVDEWDRLKTAFLHTYSYSESRYISGTLMDIKSAVNRFIRLYKNDLPNICSYLKMHHLYMDDDALDKLIDENEIEVRGLLKREERDKKKSEIKEVIKNFEV